MEPPMKKAMENGFARAEDVSAYGECSLTGRTDGPFYVAPFVVSPSAVRRRLVLHHSVVKSFAESMGAVSPDELNEEIEIAEAQVADLTAALSASQREVNALRDPAERFLRQQSEAGRSIGTRSNRREREQELKIENEKLRKRLAEYESGVAA